MNKFVLNNIRPKDYDPDFNFNLIELKIDNKYSPPLLFNNNSFKYEPNGRYNNNNNNIYIIIKKRN